MKNKNLNEPVVIGAKIFIVLIFAYVLYALYDGSKKGQYLKPKAVLLYEMIKKSK